MPLNGESRRRCCSLIVGIGITIDSGSERDANAKFPLL